MTAFLPLWIRRGVLVPACLMAATGSASRAQPLPANSPFLPPAPSPADAKAGPVAFELVGATTFGKDTLLGITRQQDKRSFWIPVGKTVAEIAAVSYDVKTDEAVIRVGGQLLTLKMRKSTIVPGAWSPPPANAIATASAAPQPNAPEPVSVPNRPLSVQEEKEMEARMLVTDLLEIGQQQRKAYEEAQRQAALRGKTGATPAPKAPAGSKP